MNSNCNDLSSPPEVDIDRLLCPQNPLSPDSQPSQCNYPLQQTQTAAVLLESSKPETSAADSIRPSAKSGLSTSGSSRQGPAPEAEMRKKPVTKPAKSKTRLGFGKPTASSLAKARAGTPVQRPASSGKAKKSLDRSVAATCNASFRSNVGQESFEAMRRRSSQIKAYDSYINDSLADMIVPQSNNTSCCSWAKSSQRKLGSGLKTPFVGRQELADKIRSTMKKQQQQQQQNPSANLSVVSTVQKANRAVVTFQNTSVVSCKGPSPPAEKNRRAANPARRNPDEEQSSAGCSFSGKQHPAVEIVNDLDPEAQPQSNKGSLLVPPIGTVAQPFSNASNKGQLGDLSHISGAGAEAESAFLENPSFIEPLQQALDHPSDKAEDQSQSQDMTMNNYDENIDEYSCDASKAEIEHIGVPKNDSHCKAEREEQHPEDIESERKDNTRVMSKKCGESTLCSYDDVALMINADKIEEYLDKLTGIEKKYNKMFSKLREEKHSSMQVVIRKCIEEEEMQELTSRSQTKELMGRYAGVLEEYRTTKRLLKEQQLVENNELLAQYRQFHKALHRCPVACESSGMYSTGAVQPA